MTLQFSTWTRWRTLDTSVEIEKLAVSDNGLLAVGGADGIVRVIQDGAIIAKWSAHTDEPITGLAFNTGSDFLFSSGHNVSTSLVLWDLRFVKCIFFQNYVLNQLSKFTATMLKKNLQI